MLVVQSNSTTEGVVEIAPEAKVAVREVYIGSMLINSCL